MLHFLRRLSFRISYQPLRWRLFKGTVELLVFDPETQATTVYLIDDELTFPELKQRELFKSYAFTLPKSVDEATSVAALLTSQQQPVDIQVQSHGHQYLLRSLTAQPEQKALLKALTSPQSIFQQAQPQQSLSQQRKIITTYYLRLQAEAFLRQKGVDGKLKLNSDLRDEVFNYLGSINQVPEQSEITRLNEIGEKISFRIAITQHKIDQILLEADRLLRLYRLGAIALTSAHFAGFGYMIFGVQWLGWDIVEPLTFSVGSLYTLLGLRFYRRFQKDRNQQNIREALQCWVLKPARRIELSNLRVRLGQQQGELEELRQKVKLAHNRLVNLTTLPSDL